jgi:superfamily I DNA/RNA helicase
MDHRSARGGLPTARNRGLRSVIGAIPARADGGKTGSGAAGRAEREGRDETKGRLSIGTMHLAKGLEFRAVVVMACDDEVIPLQERIEAVGDEADLEDVYNTERNLLYVACTRARDHVLVTGVKPASEFLGDLLG